MPGILYWGWDLSTIPHADPHGPLECAPSIATSARLPVMPFGQQSGPPASAREVRELLTLLQNAGFDDFRDARGQMGFTQRQAGGKFSREEAAAFVDRLQNAEVDPSVAVAAPAPRMSAAELALRRIPTGQLAAELERRGWIAFEP
jgi:hypothetical protein